MSCAHNFRFFLLYFVITVHQRSDGQTDIRTDGRHARGISATYIDLLLHVSLQVFGGRALSLGDILVHLSGNIPSMLLRR